MNLKLLVSLVIAFSCSALPASGSFRDALGKRYFLGPRIRDYRTPPWKHFQTKTPGTKPPMTITTEKSHCFYERGFLYASHYVCVPRKTPQPRPPVTKPPMTTPSDTRPTICFRAGGFMRHFTICRTVTPTPSPSKNPMMTTPTLPEVVVGGDDDTGLLG